MSGTKTERKGTTKDVLVNDGSATDDTGLYELYKNVVEKFIQSLIHLAESYEQNSDPTNEFRQWVARTSQVQKTSDTTSQAVSYSYGGRQTIREFNNSVARYGAPSSTDLNKNNVKTYVTGYRGNIGDPLDGDDTKLHVTYGLIDAGIDKWPGLINVEWKEWADLGIFDANHHYYPGHWAGIDCIGLTLHGLRYANDPTNNAANQYLNDAEDTPIPGINFGRGCMNKNCSDMVAITSNRALANINVKKFFNSRNTELVHYWKKTAAKTKLIRKGDLIRYKDSHISIVYSDRPACTEDENGDTTCSYEIIHASGMDYIDFNGNKIADPEEFSRKVRTNKNKWMSNPSGFGRIKLWNQ